MENSIKQTQSIFQNYAGQNNVFSKSTTKLSEEVSLLKKNTEALNQKFNDDIDIDGDIDNQVETKYNSKLEADKNNFILDAKIKKLKKMIISDLQQQTKELQKNLSEVRKNIPGLLTEKEKILLKLEEIESKIELEKKNENTIENRIMFTRGNIEKMTEQKESDFNKADDIKIVADMRPIELNTAPIVKPIPVPVNGMRDPRRIVVGG